MWLPNEAPAAPDGRRFEIESPSILRPIRVRLTLVLAIFLLLVAGVDTLNIDQLTSFHSVPAQINRCWFQNGRVLDDPSNCISDCRAAEGDFLIASSCADLRVADEQVAMPGKAIATSQTHYDKIEHDSPECELYSQFVT